MYVIAYTDGIEWIYGKAIHFKFNTEERLLVLETIDGKRHRVEKVIRLEVMEKSPNRPTEG